MLQTSSQCRRIRVGAIDAAELGPFKKWAHGHGRENEKNLPQPLAGFITGPTSKEKEKRGREGKREGGKERT